MVGLLLTLGGVFIALSSIYLAGRFILRSLGPLSPTPRFDQQGEWSVINFKWGKEFRPEGFGLLPGGSDVLITGFNRHGRKIYRIVQSADFAISLAREPDNPADENAIGVHVQKSGTDKWHKIGHLPAELSGDIAALYSDELPLAVEARRYGAKRGEGAHFIAVNVLAPYKREREKFLL